MWVILAIIIFGAMFLKEASEDASLRNECRRRGWKTYHSKDGWRYVDTNQKVKKFEDMGK